MKNYMAENEPEIPVVAGDLPNDPTGSGIDQETKQVEPGEDEKSKQDAKKDEGSSHLSEEHLKNLTDAWREDRENFQKEIDRLRGQAKSPDLTDKEEEELEGLSERERVDKIIEIREKRKSEADKAELEAAKSEIRFYERTSIEFSKNKSAILKVAKDYSCKNLDQAILIWRGLKTTNVKTAAELDAERKKNADGAPGGGSGGKPTVRPYDPKVDSNKSIADMYRSGGA